MSLLIVRVSLGRLLWALAALNIYSAPLAQGQATAAAPQQAVDLTLSLVNSSCSIVHGCDVVVTTTNRSAKEIRLRVTKGRSAFEDFTFEVRNNMTGALVTPLTREGRGILDSNGVRHPAHLTTSFPRISPGEAFTATANLAEMVQNVVPGLYVVTVRHEANKEAGWPSVSSKPLAINVMP